MQNKKEKEAKTLYDFAFLVESHRLVNRYIV